MSTNLGSIDAPQAARSTTSGWRDPRLWIGVALVAASVLIGANLLSSDDKGIEVWAATRDLQPGESVSLADLAPVRVDIGATDAGYLLAADDLPVDAVLQRPVGAGELMPAAVLGEPAAAQVEVALWAPAVSVPDAVRVGATVDVWVVPPSGGEAATPALADVRVVAAPRDNAGLGPGGDRQVVVSVPDSAADRIGAVLAAAHDGRIVLTRRG